MKEADGVRPGIEVRPAEPADMDRLVDLCRAARDEASVGSAVCSPDAAVLAQQLGAFTAMPGGTLLVAVHEHAVVGMVLGRLLGPNPFTEEASFAVEALYVAPDHRRRGTGHALMVATAELATAAGATQVYAAPLPGARGMHRFFVQLGFTPAAHHRATSTSALLRRLAEGPAARRSGPRGLEDLIARRRQSRAGSRKVAAQVATVSEAGAVVADATQPGRRAAITKQVRRAVQTRLDVESSTTIS